MMFNSSFNDFPLIKLPPETDFFFKVATIQVIAKHMRTSHKLKMQENIASMLLTILVGNFQPCL